jgi:uncharacterized membrane protein
MSKPPYILLVALPTLLFLLSQQRLRVFLRNYQMWQGLLLPIMLVGVWLMCGEDGYFRLAMSNQVGEAFRFGRSGLENLWLWLRVLVELLSPLAVVGTILLVRRSQINKKNNGGWTREQQFLFFWALTSLPIMALVAARGRYLWIPMLGFIPLVAIETRELVNISAASLQRFALILVSILLLLVVGGVPLHRVNPISSGLSRYSKLFDFQEDFICVDGDRKYRNKRMAKYSKLLLGLEYGVDASVINSEQIMSLPQIGIKLVLAEENCTNAIKESLGGYEIIAESGRTALFRFFKQK